MGLSPSQAYGLSKAQNPEYVKYVEYVVTSVICLIRLGRGRGNQVEADTAAVARTELPLAEQDRMTACRQRESDEEERDQENCHEQPRTSACVPRFPMGV